MTKYFATSTAIDERFLGILEDGIYYNPQLSRDDKDALVTSLYSLFFDTAKPEQCYTIHKLEKPYIVPLANEADSLVPDLLAALEGLFENCAMIHKSWGDGDNTKAADEAISSARAAIAKAKG